MRTSRRSARTQVWGGVQAGSIWLRSAHCQVTGVRSNRRMLRQFSWRFRRQLWRVRQARVLLAEDLYRGEIRSARTQGPQYRPGDGLRRKASLPCKDELQKKKCKPVTYLMGCLRVLHPPGRQHLRRLGQRLRAIELGPMNCCSM